MDPVRQTVGFSDAEVLCELRCILESVEFKRSKRSQQFLKHVVECALRGDVQCLKESIIGTQLFDRGPGYDTGKDSSVRVRASDVRRRLLMYHLRVGNSARVQIDISPGSYVPDISYLPSDPTTSGSTKGLERAELPGHPVNNADLAHLPHAPRVSAVPLCGYKSEAGAEQVQAAMDRTRDEADRTLYDLMARLAMVMSGDCVYVGSLTADGVIRTVAVLDGGQIAENFEYPFAGSPCSNVVRKGSLICPEDFRRNYPISTILKEREVESYAGVPLFDSKGASLGLLVVLSKQALWDAQLAKSLLELYSCRIAEQVELKMSGHAANRNEKGYPTPCESKGNAILLMRGDRFVGCNSEAVNLLGCAQEKLLRQGLFAFSPFSQADGSLSRPAGMEKIDRALRGEAITFEWRINRLDGSGFDARISLSRIDILKTVYLQAHITDVTPPTTATIRNALGNEGVGIAVTDMQGRLIETNAALQTTLGYTETELSGKTLHALTHPHDAGAEEHLVEELVLGKRENYQIEKRYLRKDGDIVWARMIATLIRNVSGSPQYLLWAAMNITDHKRTGAERETTLHYSKRF
jgi:PAS domain S-box-containing protein